MCHAPLPGNRSQIQTGGNRSQAVRDVPQAGGHQGYILHDPVAKGKCLGCHDPHGSEEPHQVRKSPQIKLCNECHNKKPVLTRKYAHKPVAEGKCLSCHRPHGSKAKKLLDASGSKLCLQQCHEKMRPVIVSREGTESFIWHPKIAPSATDPMIPTIRRC